jgi:hypothetical protein
MNNTTPATKLFFQYVSVPTGTGTYAWCQILQKMRRLTLLCNLLVHEALEVCNKH